MKIEIARPCYYWRRSREATRITVYDVTKDKVVEEHYPFNCIKAIEEGVEDETVVIEFNPNKHAVFYRYRTTTNVGRIILYHIPPNTDLDQLLEKIRKTFKYNKVYAEKARVAQGRHQILYSYLYYLPL
jgi:hypothetical protein